MEIGRGKDRESTCVTRATSERVLLVGEETGAEGKLKRVGGDRSGRRSAVGADANEIRWVWAELSEARASRRHRLASRLASANPSLSGHVGRVPGAERWVPVRSLRPCHVFHARAPLAFSSTSSSFSSSIASSFTSSASRLRLPLLHLHLPLLRLLPSRYRMILSLRYWCIVGAPDRRLNPNCTCDQWRNADRTAVHFRW